MSRFFCLFLFFVMALEIYGNPNTMNLSEVLLVNIQSFAYFKDLFRLKTYHEVLHEIKLKVKHLEPWVPGPGKIPSTAFCLLYKLFTLKLTIKQMNGMLNSRESPFIRGMAFLYLRLTSPPTQLWDWFQDYLSDEEPLRVKSGTNSKPTTIGKFVRDLVRDQHYFDLIFPRIPVKVHRELLEKLKEYEEQEKLEYGEEQGEEGAETDIVANQTVKTPQDTSTKREKEKDRGREKNRDRRRSRSPEKDGRKSRSPDRDRRRDRENYRDSLSNGSREKRRSRSPGRRRSRSPDRRRSRSPDRRRSRSPDRRRSRSPDRRRSRSPNRRRSRSPDKRRSRSPDKRRSRSPDRRRSRSPDRKRSRSPIKRRSKSPERWSKRSPSPEKGKKTAKKLRSNPELERLKAIYAPEAISAPRPAQSRPKDDCTPDTIVLGKK
eukprot:TRINITY_DN159_c0_g1_i3.p1 TRINITY_DN159_c0_g1~~TRINITY_DN159_c0_g1_i3.p1  ORF type:complete len:432 (-),score=71.14 TRINITY_DN159_c0_g1_i3:369-1664(-)